MAVSSSGTAGRTFKVDLYNQSFQRQGSVDVPVPLPPILIYQGQYYAWSFRQGAYTAAQPFTPQADLGAPALSVLANPQF